MKKSFFYTIAIAVLLTACHNEKDSPQITLTVAKQQVELNMQVLGKLRIDWGDGTKDSVFKFQSYMSDYCHKYSDTSPHTITIIGKNITYLCCNENQLIEIDISKYPKLKKLVCRINLLTSLDISKNVALKELFCGNNQLTDLNISKNAKLKWLHCGNNQLTNLDVSKNIVLYSLDCSYNPLTEIDVSKNLALEGLDCNGTRLTSLDVSKNRVLKYLYCKENQLTNLDVSNNKALKELDCTANNFSAEALNSLFERLCKTNKKNKKISINGNPGANSCNQNIAEKKGWRVIDKECNE